MSNLSETSEVPDLQPGQGAMRPVLEADLVMNVFRDGRWGSFRHQLFTNGKANRRRVAIRRRRRVGHERTERS